MIWLQQFYLVAMPVRFHQALIPEGVCLNSEFEKKERKKERMIERKKEKLNE